MICTMEDWIPNKANNEVLHVHFDRKTHRVKLCDDSCFENVCISISYRRLIQLFHFSISVFNPGLAWQKYVQTKILSMSNWNRNESCGLLKHNHALK